METLENVLSKEYELTENDFNMFKEEFKYWIIKFGLIGWELHFVFANDNDEYSARGRLVNDHTSRIALIFLNKIFEGTEPTEVSVRQTAYHEACELLLSKLKFLIESRNISDNEVEEETHNVIRVMENCFFYDDLKRRNP